MRICVAVAGSRDREHLVSNGLDLFPTICDYAGVTPPAGLPGLSLRPLVEGRAPGAWREALFIETFLDGGRGYDVHGRAVRTQRHKYTVYDRGNYREQLYDMQQDPGEMLNLAVESRHRVVLDEHRALLAGYVSTTGDRFRLPRWK